MLNEAITWPGVEGKHVPEVFVIFNALKPTPLSPAITTPALPLEEGRVVVEPH